MCHPTKGESGYIVLGADPDSIWVGVGAGLTFTCMQDIS